MNNREPSYPALMGTERRVDAADGEHGGGPFYMREGYVVVHRRILDWEWYGDESATVLFLHLMLSANWKTGRFRGDEVQAGSVITSLDKLADTFGWSRGKLRRTLDKLKSSGEVVTKTTNHWTAITLVNWAKYQNSDQPTGQQKANRAPTVRQQPATIEEGNKGIRKEENGVGLVWPTWAGEKTKAAWERFKTYRKGRDRFTYATAESEQAAINKLGKFYTSGPECVDGLEDTMARGYLFPVDPAKMNNGAKHPPPAEADPNLKAYRL